MFFENQTRDNQPLGNVRGVPIYLTTIFVTAIIVGLIFSALAGQMRSFMLFGFEAGQFWRQGQVWRLFTYLIVDRVNFFTLFNLVFLFSFGRNCEVEMGRARYAAFLAVLVVTPALVATGFWLAGFGGFVTGSVHLSMGLVIAFAAMYPNVSWWADIPLKFVAVGCVFLAAVGHLSEGDQIGLGSTLATCAVSFGYIRGMRAGFFSGLTWKGFFRRKPKLRLLPPLEQPGRARRDPGAAGDVDDLLDKIAKSGLHSLTAQEKWRLQAAREELLKKARK
jgi:membrane associated rhomboid family serine protease